METIFTATAAAAPEIPIASAHTHQRGQIIVEVIKSGFGKGEFATRCLSLNASGAGRCKGYGKCGSLFCTSHSKAGVVASPELLAAFQIAPDAVRPLVTAEKVPGGVFETKSALDTNKAKLMAPKLAKKLATNNCKKTNGETCTVPTRFADGFCHHHRNQAPRAVTAAAAAAAAPLEEDEDNFEMEEEVLPAPVASRTRNKRRGTTSRK